MSIREALQDGRPSREVLRNYRKDGTMFWNELSITPVYDEADKLMYYIGGAKGRNGACRSAASPGRIEKSSRSTQSNVSPSSHRQE